MDLNDFFGQRAKRPDHPDFWKLSEVLLRMDSGIDPKAMSQDEMEEQYKVRLAEIGIDPDVLNYASVQRAYRLLETMPPGMPDPLKAMLGSMFASLWLDGFAAGAFFERKDDN